MSSVVVIADDLTGANATGSLLTRGGFGVASCLSLEQWDEKQFAAFDVASINAASRLLPEAEARKRIQRGVAMALPLRPKVISKRIDTTLRGNLGGEIEAALAALGAGLGREVLALVVPAFPATGRIVVGGILLVNGIPLEKTSIANDPVTPLTTSTVLSLIARQTNLHGETLPLQTLLAGVEATRKAITALWRGGCRMIVADGATDEDITTVAAAVQDADFPLLAVDPGPFTAALAVVRLGVKRGSSDSKPRHCQKRAVAHPRILAVVGSAIELTQQQLAALILAHTCHFVRAECTLLANPATREAEIVRVASTVAVAPAQTKILGVCTAQRPEHVYNLRELGAQYGLAQHELSEVINGALAEIALRLLQGDGLRLGGIYASGGEVTVTLTRKLQAAGLWVRDSVLPLATYGSLIGGLYPDLPIITKGGFVGDVHGLTQCMEYMIAALAAQTAAHRQG